MKTDPEPGRLITGDRLLALAFGLFGVVWIVESRQLTYWSEFAPGSGFLPFWLGVVIVVLAAIVLGKSFASKPAELAGDEDYTPRPQRVIAITLGLFACVAALPHLGFVVSIALYLAFLIGWVERRSLLEMTVIPLAASIGIFAIFRTWLSVPLPAGPWGF